tara:strand:- start:83 stop:277 length:195 start_codon:yes stop_codon:yes gene_type:complete
LEDWRLLVALAHPSRGYVVMRGKYQVVEMNGGFAVRDITTGYVEAICMSKTKANTIADQLNRGT